MAMHHHMRQRMLEVDDLRPERPRKQKPARERAPQEPDHYRHSRKKQDLRKTRQLCGQVAKILHLCLPQAVDPALEGVHVLQVRSIDARRLEVVVFGPGPIDATLSALHRARPWLRDEVSQGIHRKRTPELVFAWSTE